MSVELAYSPIAEPEAAQRLAQILAQCFNSLTPPTGGSGLDLWNGFKHSSQTHSG